MQEVASYELLKHSVNIMAFLWILYFDSSNDVSH